MSAGRYFQLCRVLLPLTAAAAFAACSSSDEFGAPFYQSAEDAGAADASSQPTGGAGRSSQGGAAGRDAAAHDDADSGIGSGSGTHAGTSGAGGAGGAGGKSAANGGSGGARAQAGAGGSAPGAGGSAPGAGGSAPGTGGSAGGAGGAGGAGVGGSSASAGTGGAPAAVSFSDIYTGILETGCSCHNSGAGGLDLATRAIAYTNLVNVASSNCPSEQRVAPGNANASVLYHSLAHTSLGTCTVPTMPRGGAAALTQAQVDQIAAWINAGAPNN